MKQSQWILAALLLAGLVFLATFAMNYLGGSRPGVVVETLKSDRDLVFASKADALEREENTTGFVDFWFYNPHKETVQVGLNHKNCSCGGAEGFVLPDERRPWLVGQAVAQAGDRLASSLAPFTAVPELTLAPLSLHALAMENLQKGIPGRDLLEKSDMAPVEPGQLGWIRMKWSKRRAGPQQLVAELYYDIPNSANMPKLHLNLLFHSPLRVIKRVRIRSLQDEDLEKGVTEYITCWSSTRSSFRLDATTPPFRGNPASDPFIVGKPQRLNPAETAALRLANNKPTATLSKETIGEVLCAYRVPVTLRAMSADGKTPFDVGPFSREVTLRSPDIDCDPVSVVVEGRVRGVVEIENEEAGGVNFTNVIRDRGRSVKVAVESENPNLKLEFDRERTPAFLDATPPQRKDLSSTRQRWTFMAQVLPNKADGDFPREKDPLYEDSAIYLKALLPGKAPRSIRIAVKGSVR